MGNRIWVHMVDQNEGVKDFPWVLSVSNKQSSALGVSIFLALNHLFWEESRVNREKERGGEIDLQPPNLQVLPSHDDLVERVENR